MAVRIRPALLVLLLALSSFAAEDETAGFLPKDDLGVSALQREMPEADGRGVLVAVLDSGVDLLHPALQTLPDGSKKIVDYYDGTDAGEVDTKTEAVVTEGALLGLSGRRLSIGPAVPAKVRIGLVRASELYPRGLLRRLRKTKKEKQKQKKKGPDLGDPVHDLLLYEAEDGPRVLIDTDGDGDLAEETPLREYGVAQEVAILGTETRLGVGVRVLRDGAAVSLLFDGGGHGTHVAGIIAGYYGEGSPLNGLAPGARIIAAKVGNGRYGGPTTHVAMLRALTWAGEQGADVVNISFGGGSLFSDGREISAKFIDDAIARYGYAVCVSAGNAGPALQTVGSPATSRRAFSIGAWCSAATQTSNYGVIEPAGGTLFGFSSRGPLPTGAPGVDFIAPGAAVSAVPEWALASGRNMNGTSMAAPQASGAIAALLSAARREKLPSSWNRLAAALRSGAKPAPGLTAIEQGYGLIDAGSALRELRDGAGRPEPVDWIAEGHAARAVLTDRPIPLSLSLRPELGKDPPAERKARFQRLLRLTSDAEWLEVATPVHANSGGATIRALVHPTKMVPGVNVGVIRGVAIDSGLEVARHVVTMIRPRVVPRCGEWVREKLALRTGERRSLFLVAPPGATRVRVEARETAPDGGTRIVMRSADFRVGELAASEDLQPGRVTVLNRSVRELTTMEIVVQRPFRAPPGETEVEVGLCFKGLDAGVREVLIPSGRFGTHLNLRAGGPVRGRFDAKVEWTEEPLSFRWKTGKDPDGPLLLGEETLFRHVGVAEFHVPADRAEVRFDLGFESPFEDYLDDAVYAIEDGNGRVAAKGHFWRGPFSFKPPHRGRFTLRLVIWERGRKFLRGGAILSPALLRKTKPQALTVRQDIYEGFQPGGPSGRRFKLEDRSRSAALVLRPKGKGAFRGTLTFTDEDWGTGLLTLPLRVEGAGPQDRETGLREGLRALLEEEVQAARDRDGVSEKVLERLGGLADVARAADLLTPSAEAGFLVLTARRDPDASEAVLESLDKVVERARKKGGADLEASVRARAEVAILAGKAPDLAEVKGDDEGAHHLRFLAARAKGDSKAALKELDALLKTAPPRPSLARARMSLLAGVGRLPEARKILREWTASFPGREDDLPALAEELEKAEAAKKKPK